MPRPVTGSVYKEPRGTWGIRWKEGDKRPQKGGFRTKTEARDFFDEQVKPRLKRGGPSNDLLFKDFVGVYLDRWSGAPKTVKTFEERIQPAKKRFGEYSLRELEGAARDVSVWQREMEAKSANHRYVTTRALRQVLAAGVRWGYIARNPALDAGKNPQPHMEEIHPFTRGEIDAIVAEVSPADAAIVVFAAETGLRTNEWVALQRRDVIDRNSSGPQLQVLRRFANSRAVPYPKTGARRIPLSPRAVEALSWLPARLDTPLLFPAAEGGHLALPNWRTRVWYPALEGAGVEKRGPYHLRHSFATEALRRGMPIRLLARLMGNSIQMVERHYAGFGQEDLDQARRFMSGGSTASEETG